MARPEFDDEDALLLWIESQPHRDRTRTTRNYFVGKRYNREKKGEGGDQKSEEARKITGTKCSSDSTAERIGTEEGCSHIHVKRCEQMALHIDSLCKTGSGMEWARDLILTEKIKYSRLMLEEMHFRGAGY